MSGIQELHRMINPVDYRPSTHNIFYEIDATFDIRLNASHRLCDHYSRLYRDIITNSYSTAFPSVNNKNNSNHNNLAVFSNLVKGEKKSSKLHINTAPRMIPFQDRSTISTLSHLVHSGNNSNDSVTVDFLLVRSSLNDIDQAKWATYLENDIKNHSTSSVICIKYEHIGLLSAHEMFAAIYHLFCRRLEEMVGDRVRNISSSSSDSFHKNNDNNKKNSLLQFLKSHANCREILVRRSADINVACLVIIINNFDSIPCSVSQEFLCGLVSFDVKVIVIAVSKAFSFLPYRLSHAALSVIRLTEYYTASPLKLYEQFMKIVLTNSRIGPLFSRDTISALRNGFLCRHKCLDTLVKSLQFLIREHFYQRKSLLCMFQDLSWLNDMNIFRCARGSYYNQCALALPLVIQLLETDDFKGTSIEFSEGNSTERSRETQAAVSHVMNITLRHRLDQILTDILLILRDGIFRGEMSKKKFSCDVLWLAATSPNISDSLENEEKKSLNSFLESLCRSLPLLPVSSVLKVMNDVIECLQALECHIPSSAVDRYIPSLSSLLLALQERFYYLGKLLYTDTSDNCPSDNSRPDCKTSHISSSEERDHDEKLDPTNEHKKSFREYIIKDITSLIQQLVLDISSFPKDAEHLPGLLEVDVKTIDWDRFDGPIRHRTMQAVSNPMPYVQSFVNINADANRQLGPDSSILSGIIMNSESSHKTLFDIYDEFQRICCVWKNSHVIDYITSATIRRTASSRGSSNKVSGLKRKACGDNGSSRKALTDDQIDRQKRLRFTYALHDLKILGLVDIKSSKIGVDSAVTISRLAQAWLNTQ